MTHLKTNLAYWVHPYHNQNRVYSFPACFWMENLKKFHVPTEEPKTRVILYKQGFSVIYQHCPILKRLNEMFKKIDKKPRVDEETVGGLLL